MNEDEENAVRHLLVPIPANPKTVKALPTAMSPVDKVAYCVEFSSHTSSSLHTKLCTHQLLQSLIVGGDKSEIINC